MAWHRASNNPLHKPMMNFCNAFETLGWKMVASQFGQQWVNNSSGYKTTCVMRFHRLHLILENISKWLIPLSQEQIFLSHCSIILQLSITGSHVAGIMHRENSCRDGSKFCVWIIQFWWQESGQNINITTKSSLDKVNIIIYTYILHYMHGASESCSLVQNIRNILE